MCFFCDCFILWASKSPSIYNFRIFFDENVNLVGTLGDQHLKFPVVFKNAEKNKKNLRKSGI